MHLTVRAASILVVVCVVTAGSGFHARAQSVPNPCSLLTKAEMQKLTGNANAMSFPNRPDKSGAYSICIIDGGGTKELGFEFRLTTRTVRTPLKGGEPLSGIGDSATYDHTPGNARVSVAKGPYFLSVGAQSTDTPQALKDVTIAVARGAAAKLP